MRTDILTTNLSIITKPDTAWMNKVKAATSILDLIGEHGTNSRDQIDGNDITSIYMNSQQSLILKNKRRDTLIIYKDNQGRYTRAGSPMSDNAVKQLIIEFFRCQTPTEPSLPC